MLARLAVALVATSLLLLPAPRSALAQAKKAPAMNKAPAKKARVRLSERLEQLSAKLDEALKAAADVPAALKSLQDLHNRVVALRQQLDRASGVVKGFEQMRRKIDDYEERIGELELKLSAINLRLAAGPHGNAGYRDGFYIESADQKFALRVRGLLQSAYVGRIYSEARQHVGTELGQDQSTFLLRRARLQTSGHLVHRRLTYDMELEFGSIDPADPLLSLSGNLELYRGLQLRGGRLKIPFSRQFLVHAGDQLFVDRSGVVDAFAPSWDLGVVVHGEVFRRRMLSYELGIFNGAGAAERDDNTDFLYVGRLVFSPFGPVDYREGDHEVGPFRLSIGAAFFVDLSPTDLPQREGVTDAAAVAARLDQDSDGEIDNVATYTGGGELAVRYRGLALQGEVFYRLEDPGAVSPDDRTFWGFYSQLSYYYEPAALEFGGRYGFWQQPDFGADRTVVRPDELHEVSFVIAGLPWGRLIKWQVEYTHRWLRGLQKVIDADNVQTFSGLQLHQVRLQAQLAF